MEYIKLSEACTINMGQSPDSSTYNEDGKGIPFYQGKADFGEKYPKVRIWCFEPTKIAQANDILISVRAPIGALNYADTECCIGRGLAAIKPIKDRFTKEYIYYLLKSKHEELNKQGTGSTFKAISRKVLENVELPNISIHDQIEIVDRLDKIVTIIDMKKLQIKLLDNLIKSRFVELFGDKGENPNGYSEDTLGNLYKFQYGKGNNIPEDKGEYPCYGSNGIVGHHTEFNSEDAPIIGHIGAYAGIVNWGEGKHYVTYNGVICKLRTDRINPIYGFYLLQQQDFNRVATKGGGQPFVSYGDLESPTVVVPPIEIQNDYAAFAKQVDKLKLSIQKSLDKTQKLFDSLMQEYFG